LQKAVGSWQEAVGNRQGDDLLIMKATGTLLSIDLIEN
jgi:hypothetical protein